MALSSNASTSSPYYGWIEEIWELDYLKFRIPLFKCSWIHNERGVRKDKKDGFVLVDFTRFGYYDDPFVLANQAKQIFYVNDPANNRRTEGMLFPGARDVLSVSMMLRMKKSTINSTRYLHFQPVLKIIYR